MPWSIEDGFERARCSLVRLLHLPGVESLPLADGLVILEEACDLIAQLRIGREMSLVPILNFRLSEARFRERDGVLGQLLATRGVPHALEELHLERRRLPDHVDEHEPVGSGIAHLHNSGNAVAFEDDLGVGERCGLFVIVGCQECLDQAVDALGQLGVFRRRGCLSRCAASECRDCGQEEQQMADPCGPWH